MSDPTYPKDDKIQKRAQELLDTFAEFPPHFPNGSANPHLQWLRSVACLPVAHVIQFFNAWRPLSRHQPQLLLLLASFFPDQPDRKQLGVRNIEEEDGWKDGHDAHYELLDQLIVKLGGTPGIFPQSEEIMTAFHEGLIRPTTPARAAGLLAGIEHPAILITTYFHEVISRSGFADLLTSDIYLRVHTSVEPIHVIDTHESALQYLKQGLRQRSEVLTAFEEVMVFWEAFWNSAFSDLRGVSQAA
jgi:hypothetical protein